MCPKNNKRKKYARIIVLSWIVIFILFNICLKAQTKIDTIILGKPKFFNLTKPDFYTLNPQYVIKKYTISDGLPNLYITTLFIDKEGKLWFGTNGSGCGYYDGESFHSFTQHDGIPSNYIQKIFEDHKGRIWIATYENGVAYYENERWHLFTTEKGFPGKFVWDIAEDNNNNMWFAIEKVGLCKYDGKKFKTISKNSGLCSNLIRSVYCDSKNRIWAGSDGWGISMIENNKIKNYNNNHGLSHNRAISINEWNGKIWVGTYGGGLCYFENDSFYKINKLPVYDLISSINTTNDRQLLINTSGGGLQILDEFNITTINQKNGLSNDILLASCKDKHGNIWIGSYGGGISKIINSPFVSYNEKSNLQGYIAKAFLTTEDHLLISVSGQGLLTIKNDSVYQFSNKQGLPNNYIIALQKINNKEWWAATSGNGIIHFVNGKLYQFSNFEGLPSNYILSLYLDHKKRLWIGSYGYGFGYLKNDSLYWFNVSKNVRPSYVNQFTELHDTIYIATDEGLFRFFNQQLSLEKLPKEYGKNIKTILADTKGQLWVGTNSKGLLVKKGNNFIPFKYFDSKTTDHIESLLETPDGSIYIGLWNGLLRLTPQKTNVSFLNYHVKYYNSFNGFPAFNCLSNSIFYDNQGVIWIGTSQGIICFKHKNLIQNIQTPVVSIRSIDFQYKAIDWDKEKRNGTIQFNNFTTKVPQNPIFEHNYNHLTFNINLIYLHFPELCKISYRLKGLEKKFSPFTKQSKITYSNLPPGNYCLEIKTMNEDQFVSDKLFQYHFTILKPWWNEWWFYFLMILMVILSFFIFYKIRVATLIKRQKYLESEIEKATFEIRAKNDELNQQNIEIKNQRDEIESQRNLLQEQKHEIEITHNELTSSIRYAQQIQEAILPTLSIFDELNLSYFVLFKPRDIVSGDFYWTAKIDNQLIVTVADCTGHGVPGAFMSMLGIAFLKEIVQKEYITQPDLILKKMRKEIIRSLKQSNDSIHKDGMDISLISINLNTLELQFAGANNPIYIIKKSEVEESTHEKKERLENEFTLLELKPDKMPIGFHENMAAFTLQTIKLNKHDKIFLFSEGYADQFGGPKGKKFMYKQFKELLIYNSNQNMGEIKSILEQTIKEWMKKIEQVDDITVMGIEV